jgi:hypothetical protein
MPIEALSNIVRAGVGAFAAGGDNPSQYLTSSTTLGVNTRYFINSSSGAFTLTLPPAMAVGDWVELVDAGGVLATNKVTVALSGYSAIRGVAEPLLLDVNWDSLRLINTANGIFEADTSAYAPGAAGPASGVASINISPAKMFEASGSVAVAGVTAASKVIVQLVPNDDWDADDLAGYAVTALAKSGGIDLLISGPGPIVGTLKVNYFWS